MKQQRKLSVEASLSAARREGAVIGVVTPADTVTGFVVEISDDWILLHEASTEWMRMSGYIALRRNFIQGVRRKEPFVARMLTLNNENPTPRPEILLSDLTGLLSSANDAFPLFSLELDDKRPVCCYIGRVVRIGKKTLTLQEIDPQAEWNYTRRWRLSDITRVGFGGPYAAALWRIGGPDKPEFSPKKPKGKR